MTSRSSAGGDAPTGNNGAVNTNTISCSDYDQQTCAEMGCVLDQLTGVCTDPAGVSADCPPLLTYAAAQCAMLKSDFESLGCNSKFGDSTCDVFRYEYNCRQCCQQ